MAWKQIHVFMVSLMIHKTTSLEQCGVDTYSIYQAMLKDHTFETFKVRPDSHDCRHACNSDVRCQSFNYVMFKHICELNNRTKEARPEDFVKNSDRYYMLKALKRVPLASIPELPAYSCNEIKASEGGQAVSGNYWLDSTRSGNSILTRCDMKTGVADHCIKHQCRNNATCVNSHVNYTCACNSSGWTGNYCEKDVNECKEGLHGCHSYAMCNNTKGSYNCTCKPGYHGDGKSSCKAVTSCKVAYDVYRSHSSQLFNLHLDSKPISVLCHMGDFGCGDGGWTPVMKIDGSKSTFHYNSEYWSNKNEYNLAGGETGFDSQETKLPTYWNTSFSKICLGMKIDEQIRFIVINKTANSLYSLIADGNYRATSLGRNTWKTLVGSQASLQIYCNREGFNALCGNGAAKARIGFLGDEANVGCIGCDSRIGFGTGGCCDDSNTCGNEAAWSPDNGNKHIKAMGYILVQ